MYIGKRGIFMAKNISKKNEDRITMYKECRDKTSRIIKVLDHIICNHEPERRACLNENVGYMWFRRYVQQDIRNERPKENDAVRITKDDWQCWQEKFLRNLTGEEIPAPDGFDEVYEKIAKEVLTQCESDVMSMRYVEELTLRDIAEIRHQSPERVRQIEAHALRKLRRPANRYPLCYGKEYIKAKEELHTAQAEYDAAYEKKWNDVKNLSSQEIQKIREKAVELRLKTEKVRETSVEDMVLNEYEKRLNETTLDDLGLSVRAYNALDRYFLYHDIEPTVANIASLAGKLKNIRGIGRLSVVEISDTMMNLFSIDMNP